MTSPFTGLDDPDDGPPDISALLDEIATARVTRVHLDREAVAAFRAERRPARDAGKARLANLKLARLDAGTDTAATAADLENLDQGR